MRFILRLFIVSGLLIAGLLTPHTVSAHIFGGPPFLSVNGKDALTNPSYMSLPAFTIAQDLGQETYLVHRPITTVVDLTKLPVPADIARQSTFRWHWEDGGNEVTYGTTQHHTYNTIGSHLITLDVLAPGETDYLNLDTVRVNIVSSLSYKPPTVSIAAVKGTFAPNKPMTFVSRVKTDPSTSIKSYTWDFGDNSNSREKNPSHTFKQTSFLDFVFVQVVDTHGFKSEAGISVTGAKGALHLNSLTATGAAVPLVDSATSVGSSLLGLPKAVVPFIIFGLIVVIVIAIIGLALFKQRKDLKR